MVSEEKNLYLEIEAFRGVSENSLEAKWQELYMYDGMLFDILSEEQSYKVMSTIKTYDETILGISLLVFDSEYGRLTDDKPIYHQYVHPEYRGKGISKSLFKGLSSFLNYHNVIADVYIQDHVFDYYKSTKSVKVNKFSWQELEFDYS